MENKNNDTATVSKKRLEKLLNYIDWYTGNCSYCPACDVCDNHETCTDTLWGYLKGENG